MKLRTWFLDFNHSPPIARNSAHNEYFIEVVECSEYEKLKNALVEIIELSNEIDAYVPKIASIAEEALGSSKQTNKGVCVEILKHDTVHTEKTAKPWFARIVWTDPQEGGIEHEIKYNMKSQAMAYKAGFEEAKRIANEIGDGIMEEYICDVTQNTDLIERQSQYNYPAGELSAVQAAGNTFQSGSPFKTKQEIK